MFILHGISISKNYKNSGITRVISKESGLGIKSPAKLFALFKRKSQITNLANNNSNLPGLVLQIFSLVSMPVPEPVQRLTCFCQLMQAAIKS